MEYFWHYVLFLTLYLSFTEVTSNDNALSGRSSMYHGYKVFTVRISSDKDIQVLKNMEKKYQNGADIWPETFMKGDLVIFHVRTDYIKKVKDMLSRHSVPFTVNKIDMEHTIRGEITKKRMDMYEEFGYNYAKHNSFRAMHDLLKGLTDKYRRISKLEVVGCTVEKRPIYAVHISKTRSNRKPVIFIECGVHAREWASFEVCFYFISELLKQKTQKVKKITTMYDFVIIPALNPDGYVYTWAKDRMWRKNRSCALPSEHCRGSCVGVDINRNFDIEFCERGAAPFPCHESYCGPSAFSEKESQAVKKVIERLQNRMLAYFAFHSFLAVWTYPWVRTIQLPSNYKELERVANVAASTLMRNNTVYRVGSASHLIYVVTGSTVDYAFDVGRAKYAYAVELRQGKEQKTGFIMKESEIIPLCQETFPALVNSILAMRSGRN